MNPLDQRYAKLNSWLIQVMNNQNFALTPIVGDASFRRFFRLRHNQRSLVAMDVPPDKENCHSFIAIAQLFRQAGLAVPEIIASDLSNGFILVSDLGDDLYYRILNKDNVDELYAHALRDLLIIQRIKPAREFLPVFDEEKYLFELNNFLYWYLQTHRGLSLTETERKMFVDLFAQLIQSALSQPQVCSHRDYHSRNLLRLSQSQVGIVDFQDALWGPVTYDLVSLLRDCYIDWPLTKVKAWVADYHQRAVAGNIIAEVDFTLFWRWFEWMGVQRHLKAAFIFARKYHRDQDDNYLQFIPRTLNYVLQVSANYPELLPLNRYLTKVKES